MNKSGQFTLGVVSLSGGTVTVRGALDVTGAATTTAPLFLTSGSVNNVNAVLTARSSISLEGSVVDGTGAGALVIDTSAAQLVGWGLVRVPVSNTGGSVYAKSGNLVLNGGTFTNTGLLLSGPGASLFINAPSIVHTGDIAVNAGGGVFAPAANLTNETGRLVIVQGGTLALNSLTNNSTLTDGGVRGFGTISGNVDNFGTVRFNGPTQIIGSLTNRASGDIRVRNSQTLVTGTGVNSGTIKAISGGSIVFDGGLTGTPVGAPAAGAAFDGAAVVDPTGALTANYVRQSSLVLSGVAGDPASFARANIRRAADGGGTSVLSSLSIATDTSGNPLGRFDLADNAVVVNYTGGSPVAAIRSAIRSAYNPSGAAWTGPGLTSSVAATDATTAIGYGEASDVLGLSGSATGGFGGVVVDATSVLARYTKFGDATLDGAVNFADLVKVAQNYNIADGNRTWATGDFTYDGATNFEDLVKLAQNYNTALPGVVPGAPADFAADFTAAIAQVPEPSGSVLVVVGGVAVMRQRRNRSR